MIKIKNPERAKKLTELAICLTVLVLIVAAFIVNSFVSHKELVSMEEKLVELIKLEHSGSDPTASSAIIKELSITSDDLETLIKIETQTMADNNSAFAKLRNKKRAGSDDTSADELPERNAEIEALAKSYKTSSKNTVGDFLRGIQQRNDSVTSEDNQDNSSSDVQVQDKQ